MENRSRDTRGAVRPRRKEALIPALAVLAVAAVALATAVMVRRADNDPPPGISAAGLQPAAQVAQGAVVKAPPLKGPDTRAMGGASACKECGVVQMVVAVRGSEKDEPHSYQMHIRMDDGSVRTIEQRGALAAGSRVVVDGGAVKPMS